MESEHKKVFITYEQYGKMMDNLIIMLKAGMENPFQVFDYIVGLPRGGFPIAVHLSHHLEIPMSDLNYLPYKNGRVILVDDILDTGETMEKALEQFSVAPLIVVLHWKPHSSVTPDIYVEETTDWIVYPWEKPDEKPNRKMYEHL